MNTEEISIRNNGNKNEEEDKNDQLYQKIPISSVCKEKEKEDFWNYYHLCKSLDYICIFFAIIGSLSTGIAMPMIAFLTGDDYYSIRDSNDFQLSSDP